MYLFSMPCIFYYLISSGVGSGGITDISFKVKAVKNFTNDMLLRVLYKISKETFKQKDMKGHRPDFCNTK